MAYSEGQPLWRPVGVKTVAYAAKPWDFAEFDCTTATVTQALPSGAEVGAMFMVKRVDLANTSLATTGSLAVVPPSGETFRNGLGTNTSIPISGQDQTRTFLKETATQWTALVDDPLPSLYPRFPRSLGTQVAVKAGDTVTASVVGTTETLFASTLTLAANSLFVGQVIDLAIAGSYRQSTAGPTQQPRVRIGPAATAATSRAVANDFGPISGLLATASGAIFYGKAMYTVDSINGTQAVLRSIAQLDFVSAASGQQTGFLAGPTPGVYGTVTIDPTVANLICLSVQFSNATANNWTALQQFRMFGMQPAVGST